MIGPVLVVLALVIAILLLIAARRPDSFHLRRSILIAAPPEAVYPHAADLRAFTRWSPWQTLDPAMRMHIEGAPGVGQSYAWDGNKSVGTGRMEITAAEPGRLVRVKLNFLKPFVAHNTVDFTFTPVPGGTEATWAMSGPHPFMMRLMSLVFSMERMVGPQFERGLANLKAIVEAGMDDPPADHPAIGKS